MMPVNETELMRAYARLRDRRRNQSGATSPASIDEVLALAEHPPRDAAGLARLDAVLADPATRDEYVMLRALAREGSARGFSATRWYAVAAVALIAVALPLAWRATRSDAPVMRGAPDGFDVVEPPVGDSVVAAGVRITWRAVARSSYVVELLDESAVAVWTMPTPDTSIVLPDGLPLSSGVLSLQVTATTPEGAEQRTTARRVIAKG